MKLYMAMWGGGHPFDMLPFTEEAVVRSPDELDSHGALVIWGGSDISPTIYGKKVSRRTHADVQLSSRDECEVALAKRAIQLGMPIIGVCRGAQILCGLAGGHLIQHVNRHGGTHPVKTYDGQSIVTNSIHHQMMYPFDVEHEMRAFIEKPLSDVHIDVDDNGHDFDRKLSIEPEYVYFPKIKGYAVQWHPEGMAGNSAANEWLLNDLAKGIFQIDKLTKEVFHATT